MTEPNALVETIVRLRDNTEDLQRQLSQALSLIGELNSQQSTLQHNLAATQARLTGLLVACLDAIDALDDPIREIDARQVLTAGVAAARAGTPEWSPVDATAVPEFEAMAID